MSRGGRREKGPAARLRGGAPIGRTRDAHGASGTPGSSSSRSGSYGFGIQPG
jgi:hypothetical protein